MKRLESGIHRRHAVYSMRCVFALAVYCIFTMYAQAANTPSTQLMTHKWTVASGLPQNSIRALTQTSDGYLWIGTPSGLIRFDGVRFTLFNRLNTPILKSERITALHAAPDHRLLIASEGGGLYIYHHGEWTRYSKAEGLSNDNVRAVVIDYQDNLWVGTDYGLNKISAAGITHYTTTHGLYS
ncbi:hypothetical protein JXO59_11835, partial [candidate division KSB1 bacterium]|nr:hypothetical protein [candidate division KSB1 bacterium]